MFDVESFFKSNPRVLLVKSTCFSCDLPLGKCLVTANGKQVYWRCDNCASRLFGRRGIGRWLKKDYKVQLIGVSTLEFEDILKYLCKE